jgi:hypothetical protein
MSNNALYMCARMSCDEQEFESLNEVIEHVRSAHKLRFIHRPGGLGERDGHGHLWQCFACDTKSFKGHRSYDSDQAMWNHLNSCHDSDLDDIKPGQ